MTLSPSSVELPVGGSLGSVIPSTLSLTIFVFAVAVLVTALAAIWRFRSWQRLRHVPGPFWHSLSIFPLCKLVMSGRVSYSLHSIQKKYGKQNC